ncbi:MAG: leucine--tRNA ligase [Candidatus Paceibacterota bacterium]|jgi:leucyl-tRNA synthetase
MKKKTYGGQTSGDKSKEYSPSLIENKWQRKWKSSKLFKTKEDTKKDKYYILDMFPYPSGEGLHVGHPKGYIATDIVSRYRRMSGYSVLHPMGFDAFGLPAENYAIQMKTNPAIAVSQNVKRFKKQLEILGFDYDWSREVNTTDPKYYKWTQWIFLQLLNKGLAYESYEPINWCPSCKTGLANEDVDDGRCERCGTPVEKKPMRQWVLKITDYAGRLLEDLDVKNNDDKPLLDWPESIKEAQRNWIGRSEGAEIKFQISNFKGQKLEKNIKVFTTRPDTIFGVTYLVLAPEHRLVKELLPLVENKKEVEEYVGRAKNETEIERTDAKKEKTGVEMKGIKVINPANREEIPVWIADYVLADYGTGAVMAVPSHDERDWDFAKKFDLPIKQVIAPYFTDNPGSKDAVRDNKKTVKRKTAYALVFDKKNDKFLCLNWEKFGWHSGIIGGVDDGESFKDAALREIKEETGYKNLNLIKKLGGEQHNHFFATHKDENRYAIGHGMLFELVNDEKELVLEEHSLNHKPVWIDMDKMEDWLNLSAFKYMWKAYKSNSDCFTGYGRLLNSEKFDGTESKDVMKEITDFVGGQWVTKYKLRDWVFSRQRYWGEPIPVIHCTNCFAKENKTNAIILHGCPSNVERAMDPKRQTYDKHWIPWTKKQLEIAGIETLVPLMPEPWHMSYEKWKIEFDKLPITENSILIGHSCGSAFLVRWLGETKKKVRMLVLVAPWKINSNNDEFRNKFYTYTIDNEIKDKIKNIFIFTSDDEEDNGKKSVNIFRESLNAKVIELKKHGHYIYGDMKTEEFPELINLISSFSSKVVPVPEKDLPIKLPKVKSYEPTGTGESPLANIDKWVNVKCPKCKGKAKRETNTMPQWAGSSWYYLRYEDPKNKKAFVDTKKDKYWSPVDLYVGGAEHATRHLIYARFWHKFLYDIGIVSTIEPFIKLQNVGLIIGEDGRKMSKRFGNVVNPDEIVEIYGADTLRIYEMFMGPFDQQIAWNTNSMVGSRRFIEKVWRLNNNLKTNRGSTVAGATNGDLAKPTKAFSRPEEGDPYLILIDKTLHKAIKKVTEDIQGLKFNTALSTLMIAVNEMESSGSVTREQFEILLKLLAPFAPYVTEELWSGLGNKKSIHISEWPEYDPSLIVDNEVKIIVQVNGKVRGSFDADPDINEEEMKKKALNLPEVKKWIDGNQIKKVIVVKSKLVSLVV